MRVSEGTLRDGKPYFVEWARVCPACRGGHAQRAEDAHRRAAVPSAYSDVLLKDFSWDVYPGADLTRQRRRAEAFVGRFPDFEARSMGLYIFSRTRGSGKSFLASALVNEIIRRYAAGTRFVSCADLLTFAQRRREDGGDPLEELLSVRLLVLDDLGVKRTGEAWLSDVLFRITDTRSREGRVTVFTSNLPFGELEFDDRIADRINRFSLGVALPEYCVRARKANEEKRQLLESLGIE